MIVKEFIDLLLEYNPEAEIKLENINDLGEKYFEIYYRGGPDEKKETCEFVRIYIGDEIDFL